MIHQNLCVLILPVFPVSYHPQREIPAGKIRTQRLWWVSFGLGTELVKDGRRLTGLKQGSVVSVVLWKAPSGSAVETGAELDRGGTSQEDFVIAHERGQDAPVD